MDMRGWFLRHYRKLGELEGTPEAIARGVGIGIFLGFTPLFGLKTLLAIVVAWLLRGNRLAAAIAVTLHDIAFPLMPLIFRWEYQIGFWLLKTPHRLPSKMHLAGLHPSELFKWTTFFDVGAPLLVGSLVFAAPCAVVAYLIAKSLVVEFRARQFDSHHRPSP